MHEAFEAFEVNLRERGLPGASVAVSGSGERVVHQYGGGTGAARTPAPAPAPAPGNATRWSHMVHDHGPTVRCAHVLADRARSTAGSSRDAGLPDT
ncbi:hypothetical protein SZN_30507 [Streptomyces zinciresistens K42]|uniref:Uncharacterized protein n=1 Tax=Streptomyces zinciresistens K42 TaxID=700597 RepID=G2GKQ8_9ACTN|nr:hypothetical protein [Streptomyces zinciresistens]EGX55907.1 hypothetical protein SZN_30507 [Streptomyces zinciresistens K42]